MFSDRGFKNVFIICPVRQVPEEVRTTLEQYVVQLEQNGYHVHYPSRDTNQEDPTGGYDICMTNVDRIFHAHEVHIWYDPQSFGSCFDMGALVMVHFLGLRAKKVIVINEKEIEDVPGKSFLKVIKRLQRTTWGRG